MRNYQALVMALVALPAVIVACGDGDDDAPADTGGGGGSSGSATGGKGGGSGKGGTSGEGGTQGGGSGGTRGGSGGASGMGGEPPGGAGGEETGGTSGTGGNTGCDLSGDGKPHDAIPADIDSDLTLTSDTVWDLSGFTKVHDGAVLTIEPCTRIEGSPAPSPGVLAVLRGGQIDAAGTANEPILFTSASSPGARAAGQWGGVVLLGNAPITAASTSKVFEGLTDTDFTYGGADDADDSGTMQYVRIEFAGWNILPDKEINGLSMAAVGSGTTLDHIMVSNIRDDCFEWWGGSVDADYLICNNPGDDMFDSDEGYVAAGNYWFGRRTGVTVISSTDPSGFEWDGTEGGADLSPKPRTHVTASNVTLCGTGAAVSMGGGAPEFGMVLRELIEGEIDGAAVLGFEYGLDTRNQFMTGDVTIDNSIFWSLANAVGAPDSTDNDMGFVDATIVTGGTNNETMPTPVPFTLADCQHEGGPSDAVKESDVGAFAGDATWMEGLWVDFSAN